MTEAPPLAPGDHCNRLSTTFEAGVPLPSTPSPSWPNFRGPNSDNILTASVPLRRNWDQEPPPILWTLTMGEGHAAPALYEGQLFVLDYDEEKNADALRCIDLESGREIWRRWYPVVIKRNHGISRTIPAVSDDAVVSIGPKCHVMCVDRRTGDLRWGLDLEKDYGTTVPLWYTGQCPIIVDGAAVIAPAGYWLLMAVDCRTGRIRWKTPNSDRWTMSHSSVMPMVFDGTRALVYAALGGVAAVSLDADSEGQILWKTSQWDRRIVAPSPVLISGNRVLLTAGHGAGTLILPIAAAGGSFDVQAGVPIDKTVFACEQQTPIYANGHLYTLLPKDAGELREQLICYSMQNGMTWHSGKEHRFGLGPYILAGQTIIALADNGTLSMVDADPREFRLLEQTKLIDGRDAWGPLVLADGLLILRDATRMLCVDLRQPTRKDMQP